jgi:quercetin dioxygenase-like cupin family protein
MSTAPKTIFCDIDGTLLHHNGDVVSNYQDEPILLSGALENIKQWEKNNFTIVLTTGRKECLRENTEQQLLKMGIIYDKLIMGLPNGDRILVNDKKLKSGRNTAYAVNLVRNQGMSQIDLTSNNITIRNELLFTKIEKPWGYEELVECNDRYVVKKLFMAKGNACSIQYHELKTETITVLFGLLRIYIGTIGEPIDQLTYKDYSMGQTITIKPYTVHRMQAIDDSLYIECSTNELWDVVRLQDNYNRI